MRQRVLGIENAGLRRLAASGFALLIGSGSAFAQSGDLRAQDQSKPPASGQAAPERVMVIRDENSAHMSPSPPGSADPGLRYLNHPPALDTGSVTRNRVPFCGSL